MNLEQVKFLARDLMDQHNLTDWKLDFNDAVRRFGYCAYWRKIISISKPLSLLNNESRVRNTILHEIAHALTKSGHDKAFYKKCIEIGAEPKRCYPESVIRPEPKHIYACSTCGYRYERIKKIKRHKLSYHGACGPKKGSLVKIK